MVDGGGAVHDTLFTGFVEVGIACVCTLQETFACGVVGYPGIRATIDTLSDGISCVSVVEGVHFRQGYTITYAGLGVGIGVAA